jgi:hypothetical protein
MSWFLRNRFWERLIANVGIVLVFWAFYRDEVIELRPGQSAASLHALLVGVRNQAQALLDRLETRGVYVPRDGQREVVRALYVATRNRCRRWPHVWNWKGYAFVRGPSPVLQPVWGCSDFSLLLLRTGLVEVFEQRHDVLKIY